MGYRFLKIAASPHWQSIATS